MSTPFFTADAQQTADLDTAWQNFDPQLPLPGDDHPFYVHRPGEPVKRLANALRLSVGKASKFFFTGYRGSGKSTELNRLALWPEIAARYWVVSYSVKETADIQNLDYRDVLLTLGAQMYEQFLQQGGILAGDRLRELEGWKDRTVERIKEKGVSFEGGGGLDLKAFFATITLKAKTEHGTRETIREVIGPRVAEFIEKIDLIATDIQVRKRKPVLVLVDDLDKLNLDNARRLFNDNLTALTQPACAIVYTIPSALLYEDTFVVAQLAPSKYQVENIRLHARHDPQQRDAEAYRFFHEFVTRRMKPDLIEPPAVDALIAMSGGVTSALVFAVQSAINNALQRDGAQVTLADVTWARGQLRNPLQRLLSDEDVAVLQTIHQEQPERLPDPRRHARLVHIQAVLQYCGDDDADWFDVNPVLEEALTV